MKRKRTRSFVRRYLAIAAWSCAWLVLFSIQVLCTIMGFGISVQDRADLIAFNDAVTRWQNTPDFRDVQSEYISVSYAAMNTRPLGFHLQRAIMAMRSLPLLPDSLKLNNDSEVHYADFTNGRLLAYLRLTSEQ